MRAYVKDGLRIAEDLDQWPMGGQRQQGRP